MSIPQSPMNTHGIKRKVKRVICFLLVLIIELGIIWNAEPRKQTPLEPATYSVSGEEYNYFLLKDRKWLIDGRSPRKLIQLIPGDQSVDNKTIKYIGNVIQSTSIKAVYTITEMHYDAPVNLYIISNENTYTKELKTYFTGSRLTNEVNESVGIQFNNFIYLPIYKFYDFTANGELENTLAHELTHVVLYQNGIEAKLPIWINEGFSWYVGNHAEKEVNPQAEIELEQEIQDSISYEAKNYKLYKLDQNNTMFTNNEPEYNLEWEDYLAVKELISQFGMERFRAFISNLKNESVEVGFQKTFGISLATFEQNFYNEEISNAR